MSIPNNLPPGVRDCDIPGNSPEDIAWDKAIEAIERITINEGLNAEEMAFAFAMGVQALRVVREHLNVTPE
jgi:hypothetical protein